jgi:hypothetical protein
MSTLPDHVSKSLAAKLARVSRHTFERRFVGTGLVELHRVPRGHARVVLASLARLLGQDIDWDQMLEAERSLDHIRRRQSAYRRRREATRLAGAGDVHL